MKVISILLVSILLMISIQSSGAASETTIYYLPFEAETYTPLTITNIKARALYQLKVEDVKASLTLCDLISGGKQTSTFDEDRVRLLVVYGEAKCHVYVDAIGNIYDGKTKRALSTRHFTKLKKLLFELTKNAPVSNERPLKGASQ